MQNIYLGFKFAFSYFSILPISFKSTDDLSHREVLRYMLLFFPLVGLVLGMISIGLFSILLPLSWFGAIISATLYMILYGFLHTEAVSDVADAIYASHSNKDPYIVIKEPTIGAMGLLWSMVLVILKISGMVFLFTHQILLPFVGVLMVSRLVLLMLFYTQSFRSTFATQLKEALEGRYLFGAFIVYISIGYLILDWQFIVLLSIGLIVGHIIATTIKSKIGFANGDLLGATLEWVETILFVVVALMWL